MGSDGRVLSHGLGFLLQWSWGMTFNLPHIGQEGVLHFLFCSVLVFDFMLDLDAEMSDEGACCFMHRPGSRQDGPIVGT